VIELAQSSEQIAAAASQVSSSSQSLAQGASEQAATIEETSSVSVEINSMAQRNTENSRQTAEIVTGSEAGFQRANSSLSEMVVAMEGISSSSQKISKIIKVIDEIAFQTNILALNAAVEAARAGDAGMGFAVVADEVRSLAQRCAQAAKDTTDLIEDSIQKSDGGMIKVDQVAVAIREITAQSAQIKTLVDEINLGSIEQSRGIDQISRSIGQMEQVTQSSAANAEETAAAAEQLSAQAKTMNDVVARLRSMVQSDSESHLSHASASSVRTHSHAASNTRPLSIKTRSTVSFPRPAARKTVPASSAAKPVPVASGAFPMDDDFKEF
jgi:methyl-accepting chemotaxis protein/methyl-accepting chemotaxis protein-1 (serine sensor receptor)